ncbi:hypothetical protein KCU65_g6539, partial [Aureobasidium melanogenum]
MPSPRNSKFIENFDDEQSDTSSSESLASAPSPKLSSDSVSSDSLAEKLSAMVLGHETPRAVHHPQPPAAMQPQVPTQAQAPGAVQGSGSAAVDTEILAQRALDCFDELQKVNPEEGTSQQEQNDATEEPSAKTANIFLHQFLDQVLTEQKITSEEMHHASKHIEANFKKLEQDLILFAGQRLQISQELQKWFVIHKHDSDWEIKTYCQTCLLLFEEIDKIYFVAFSNVRDMMEVLEKGLRVSALFYHSDDKPVSDLTQNQTLGEFCAPLLQNLESTERMLQALEDNAEERKGWPQVYSSEEYSSMISQPEDVQDDKTQSESDQTKDEANANSAAIIFFQVNKVFGNEVLPLEIFEHMIGCTDNQVSFATNSVGDISAQQWSQSDRQWFCIGYFSKFSKRIEGDLALHQLRVDVTQHARALPQNSLAYFKAVARQHEASMMNTKFGPEELQACLRKIPLNRVEQEVPNTPSIAEPSARPEAGSGAAEMADEEHDAKIDDAEIEGAKSKQVKGKKSKSKKQKKKGRR